MKSVSSNWHSLITGLVVLGAVGVALVAVAAGCDTGGNEGDRCNPLVQQDECDNGLHCQAATCSESYCCPTNRTSTDPHCNAVGCPDTDAGEAGATEGGSETGADAAADVEPEAAASDGGDSG